jgi:TolA-binding protein
MAGVHEDQGRSEDAIATYLEMAARYPAHPRAPEALVQMADAILQSRRRDKEAEARRIYTDVVAKYPSSPWAPRALLARGGLEERRRLWQGDAILSTSVPMALITYRDLASRYPRAPEREHALWRLAQLQMDIRRYDLAAESLRDLGARYSSSRYEAWFTAAELYEKRLNDPFRARSAYAQVPSTSPKYAEAQKRLTRP